MISPLSGSRHGRRAAWFRWHLIRLFVILKRTRLASMLAMFLLLSACKPHELAWVDDVNAEKMVAQDTAHGRIRFFSVCGYSCFVPGVGTTNAKLCYSKAVVQVIQGTGDVVESDEGARLNVMAHNFAERYNLLVKSYLRRENKSQCDPSTDWDGGHYAMHQYVQSLNGNAHEAGQVALIVGRSEFTVTLPSTVSFEQAFPVLCSLIASNGLAGIATVKLDHRGNTDAVATQLNCAFRKGE
jgi:hypothetical protein